MRFWSREAAGWALIVLGLAAFGASYLFLLAGSIVEAMFMIPAGVFIFRGGIHLLKVAVAARVCMEAAEKKPRDARPVMVTTNRVRGPDKRARRG
jgi:small neutral amino acid transporter SnatA (MarC family)